MTEGPATPTISLVEDGVATASGEPRLEPPNRRDEALNASTVRAVASQPPDVIRYEYESLLQSLDTDCRRIVASAHSEAETIRSEAREECRRRVSSAHREEAMVLSRAADQQVAIYRDTQNEVDRRLEELEQERTSVLAAARADAEEMRRTAKDAEERAHAALRSAEEEARAIVARAHAEARNVRGHATPAGDVDRVVLSPCAERDLNELLQEVSRNGMDPEPGGPPLVDDPTPAGPTLSDPSPGARRVASRRRARWWSRKR